MPLDNVFGKRFQDNVVAALVSDSEFLATACGILTPDAFLTPVVRRLVELIYEFHASYGTAPGDNFQTYFEQLAVTGALLGEDADLCRSYLKDISGLTPNTQYLLETLSAWARRQAVKAAMLETAPMVELGSSAELTRAQEIMEKAWQSGVDTYEVGLNPFTMTHLPFDYQEPDLRFMIPALDRVLGGMKRGELVVFHGTPNVGKTWALIHLFASALIQGLGAVFYSGEMTQNQIAMRCGQNFGGLSDRVRAETVSWNQGYGTFEKLLSPATVFDDSRFRDAMRHMAGFGGRPLIKTFVPGEFTVDDINAHLSMLGTSHGLYPTLIVVDYDELLSSRRKYDEKRWELQDVYDGMKGLATKRSLIVATGSQSNQRGLNAPVINMNHLSEAFGKAKPSDLMISMNQTESEYESHQMRLFVYKNRNGPRYQMVRVYQNYDLGQFALHSERVRFETERTPEATTT